MAFLVTRYEHSSDALGRLSQKRVFIRTTHQDSEGRFIHLLAKKTPAESDHWQMLKYDADQDEWYHFAPTFPSVKQQLDDILKKY